MEFGWSPAEEQLYADYLRFAREQLAPAAPMDEPARWRAAWQTCARAGLAGLPVPSRYGGRALDALLTSKVLEAIGAACPDNGFSFSLAAHLMACCIPIANHGTEEQKARYLPRLCGGDWVGAGALTEPDAGSDAFALRARAVRDDDAYVVTGEKTFVTNGPYADVLVVYATTAPRQGLFGITAFVVERDTSGLSISAPLEKFGLTSARMATLSLNACRIPAAQRLGAEGAGAAIFHDAMAWERTCLFGLWVGAMERQLDEVVARATSRRQFGRLIGANQAVSHRIASMKLRLESARLLLYYASWQRARGVPSDLFASLAKLAVSEAFVQSSLDAVQIFGGRGVLRDGIEQYVRDALPGTIYSGTSEMQREIIARALGLVAQPSHRVAAAAPARRADRRSAHVSGTAGTET